jgi:hypothetical protein
MRQQVNKSNGQRLFPRMPFLIPEKMTMVKPEMAAYPSFAAAGIWRQFFRTEKLPNRQAEPRIGAARAEVNAGKSRMFYDYRHSLSTFISS